MIWISWRGTYHARKGKHRTTLCGKLPPRMGVVEWNSALFPLASPEPPELRKCVRCAISARRIAE